MWVWSQEDSLEEEMATHSSILALKIPWMEEPQGHKELDMSEWLSILRVTEHPESEGASWEWVGLWFD